MLNLLDIGRSLILHPCDLKNRHIYKPGVRITGWYMSDVVLRCSLLWTLCRKHRWGGPITKEGLVDLALESSDQGRGKEVVEDLVEEPYITLTRNNGYRVKNDPDSQAQAAYRLTTTCGYDEFRVEATLSRFDDAGGFSAYDREEVLSGLADW